MSFKTMDDGQVLLYAVSFEGTIPALLETNILIYSPFRFAFDVCTTLHLDLI